MTKAWIYFSKSSWRNDHYGIEFTIFGTKPAKSAAGGINGGNFLSYPYLIHFFELPEKQDIIWFFYITIHQEGRFCLLLAQ
jgi:hypothetical protein